MTLFAHSWHKICGSDSLFCRSESSWLRAFIICLIYALFCLGLVMIYSTASAQQLDRALPLSTPLALLAKQLTHALIAIAIAYGLFLTPLKSWMAYSPWLMGALVLVLVLLLIPGWAREMNGSKRWFLLFGFSIQPSELVKVVMPSYLIAQFSHSRPRSSQEWCKRLCLPALSILLVLLEPNNGTAALLLVELLFLLWLLGTPWLVALLPLFLLMTAIGISAISSPYVQSRLEVFWHPEKDLLGRGHQPHQAKIAVGSGGLWGKGVGHSLQKFSYLPEAHNDYIAAIFAEEFGFGGVTLLITLWMLLAATLFSLCLECQQVPHLCLLAAAMSFGLLTQATMNLAVVVGLCPATGLNLPFFSHGGCSLLASCCAIALALKAHKESTAHSSIVP